MSTLSHVSSIAGKSIPDLDSQLEEELFVWWVTFFYEGQSQNSPEMEYQGVKGRSVDANQHHIVGRSFPEHSSHDEKDSSWRARRSAILRDNNLVVLLAQHAEKSRWFVANEWHDIFHAKAEAIVDEVLRKEDSVKIYHCDQCPTTTDSAQSIGSHKARTKGKHGTLTLHCPANDGCVWILSTYRALANHVVRSHKDWLGDRHMCGHCGHLFPSLSDLAFHRSEVRGTKASKARKRKTAKAAVKKVAPRVTQKMPEIRQTIESALTPEVQSAISNLILAVSGSSDGIDWKTRALKAEKELTEFKTKFDSFVKQFQ